MNSVLQIMDYAAPYKGNFISAIECLEAHYRGNGNTIYLFPDRAKGLTWVNNLIANCKQVYFIDASFFSRKIKLSNLKRLGAIVEKENISIIHTHFVEYNYTLYLYKKLFRKSIKFVANFHNHYFPSGRLYLLKNYVIRNTIDYFIGDSLSVSESLYKIGIPEEKMATINNAINFSRLKECSELTITVQGSNQSVLMFGYPWYRKGVDVVVRALNELNKEITAPVTLALAQAGCFDITRDAIIKTLGYLPGWVTFLGPRDDLATYYNAADLFISAGREEGLSYSPIEAAWCNCLLICSNIPGNPLDIPAMPVYEVEDHELLKILIESVLAINMDEMRQIKIRQRNFVVENYNITTWVEKVADCYKILI